MPVHTSDRSLHQCVTTLTIPEIKRCTFQLWVHYQRVPIAVADVAVVAASPTRAAIACTPLPCLAFLILRRADRQPRRRKKKDLPEGTLPISPPAALGSFSTQAAPDVRKNGLSEPQRVDNPPARGSKRGTRKSGTKARADGAGRVAITSRPQGGAPSYGMKQRDASPRMIPTSLLTKCRTHKQSATWNPRS